MAKDEATKILCDISLDDAVYKKDVISKLSNAPIEALRGISVMNPRQVQIRSEKSGSHYSVKFQIIELGMKGVYKEENSDVSMKGRILYHEIGHLIDAKFEWISKGDKYAKNFKSALWKETKAIIADYDSRMDMNSLYGNLKADRSIVVSDMLSAVYKNKIPVPYKHKGVYWKSDKYNINCEAFAHFYSALFIPSLMPQISKYYPVSFKLFMKMMKEIGG